MTARAECTAFLQWCLPRLEMRWSGFRRVRSQICKRIARRMRQLGLDGFDEYRRYLEHNDGEWLRLDGLCRVTISRFFRDREVFDALRHEVIPDLAAAAVAARRSTLQGWSCGCASGEEPYSLAMAWTFELSAAYPSLAFEITATDADPSMLDRARHARFQATSVRDLPGSWLRRGFVEVSGELEVASVIRGAIDWRLQDVRSGLPDRVFDLVLCRNLVFTYYGNDLQHRILRDLAGVIRPGGALVLGSHESLPDPPSGFEPWDATRSVYRRAVTQARKAVPRRS